MKQRLALSLPVFSPILVCLVALAGTLGALLIAPAGATRVAALASSVAWPRIEAAGIPVLRLAASGHSIVLNGRQAPAGLARLRASSPFLIDASLIPGCAPDDPPLAEKVLS